MDNSPNSHTFNVTVNDLKQIIYFIVNKFRIDPLHIQGTSSKRDLIGGFIDRWINRTAEYLFLNRLLESLNKEYRVVSDFYLYTNKVEKNAPDVLGLVSYKENDPKVIFSKYKNRSWVNNAETPFIEVKAIRPDQNLLAVRDTQMEDDHYYIFVETDFRNDYLISMFTESFFQNQQLHNKIKMSSEFIENDEDKNIIEPKLIEYDYSDNIVGKFSLIGTFLGINVKKYAGYYKEKEGFYYLFDIRKHPKKKGVVERCIFKEDLTKFNYSLGDNSLKYLPIFITGNCSVNFTEKNKTTAYFDLRTRGEEIWFNQFKLSDGSYKIQFKYMKRSSNWREFFLCKDYFKSLNKIVGDYPQISKVLPNDRTLDLIEVFDAFWNNL